MGKKIIFIVIAAFLAICTVNSLNAYRAAIKERDAREGSKEA